MSANNPLSVDQGASLITTFVYVEDVAAATWTAGFPYELGAVVVPSASTGFVYTASTAGLSAATQPTFPVVLCSEL